MSLNAVPSGERVHIAFFGRRNVGKSSLVNAVTGQELSLVSDVKGTTTDPVRKAMELLPLGPVVIIDTPGLDDEGDLGQMRVRRAREVLAQTDIAVLVTDVPACTEAELPRWEQELLALVRERKIPCLIACNKADLREASPVTEEAEQAAGGDILFLPVSALTGQGVNCLKEQLAAFAKQWENARRVLVRDLISSGDTVVLVIPVDESAPKGRLILPQQQVMRDILDAHGHFLACQPEELADMLERLKAPPSLVITDSQAFGRVAETLPRELPLTSFSILFARYKGQLEVLVRGAEVLGSLRDGDRVLISEGCTHHRQCNDIGTVKMPGWIRAACGAEPVFSFTSGGSFPEDLSEYRLIVHCGGCMLNEKEMGRRMKMAAAAGVPMVNYGAAIACMHGILERSLEPLQQSKWQS